MAYQQITLFVHERIAEQLSDALMEHGALSTAIEDAYAGTDEEQAIFGEPGMPGGQIWQRSKVVALFNEEDNAKAILATASEALSIEPPPFQTELLPEQDWVRLTQSQFDPIRVSERLWIVPSWHEAPDPEALVLVLDPGMAFGTGSHPTTRLCLEWLERTVTPGTTILDYGCGSGILAIAAAKLGAAGVLGVDIDAQAVTAARDNAKRNGIAARFEDSAQEIRGQFDIVVANILSNPLKALAPAICAHVRPGGALAISGILSEQADELIAIYTPFLRLEIADTRDGWVCLTGRKS